MIEHILLAHGRRKPAFLKSQTLWQPLIPLLMDAAYVDIDDSITEFSGRGAPIEAKLRLLAIQLLYEVSRSQKLSVQDLRERNRLEYLSMANSNLDICLGIFDDNFVIHLFDLVEDTRDLEDEDTFNYSCIKLIVCTLAYILPSLW
jgi:hypothetical protein